MDLADLELMRAQISNHIIILNKLLQRPMFRTCFVQVGLLLRNDRSVAQLFEVEARVEELSVSSGWHSMKVFRRIE